MLAMLALTAAHNALGGTLTMSVRLDDWGAKSSVIANADLANKAFAIFMEVDGKFSWVDDPLSDLGRPVYVGRLDNSHLDANGLLIRLANREISNAMPSGSFNLMRAVNERWDATHVTPQTQFHLVLFASERVARLESIDLQAELCQVFRMTRSRATEDGGVNVEFVVRPNTSWTRFANPPKHSNFHDRTQWTEIPEPHTMALIGIAIVAFGLQRRRRN